MKLINPIALFIFLNALVPLSAKPLEGYTANHWQKWHKKHEQEYTGKGGWLSLAGLYWLKQGKKTIGSHENNKHIFPPKTPDFLGSIDVNDKGIIFNVNNDSIIVNGNRVGKTTLSITGDSIVTFGHYKFHII